MASTTSATLPLSSSSYLVVECKTSRKSAAPSLALPTVHQLSSQSSQNLVFKNVTYCRKIASKVAVTTTGEAAVATIAEAAVAEAAVAEAAVAEAAVAEAATAEEAVAEAAVAEEAEAAVAEEAEAAVAEAAIAEAAVAEAAVAEAAVAEAAVAEATIAEAAVAEAAVAEAAVAEAAVAEAAVAEATELPEIVKTVQKAWDEVEDKYTVSSLAVAGFVGLWASAGMVSALDQLPIVPGLLEVVGVGYSGWFAYRNLIFKSDRDALIKKIKDTYKDIIGSSN